jgi:tRNA(fMet)-specific endonuclease VapC
MEGLVCLDASVLIEYFRNRNKKETFFPSLSLNYPGFVLPAIAHFEIYTGCTPQQKIFWDNLFADFLILPFTTSVSFEAVSIQKLLKSVGINIEFKDLAIAATAKSYGYPLATLNEKHFINM